MNDFVIEADYSLTGDQPEAVAALGDGVLRGDRYQTLLGVTGSGKTFTMANVIEKVQKPTLVIAHNKTLAAQLCNEFREFLPGNAVEYFVSYYDYYQPEAYVPAQDLYIEKDSSINDEIDRLRHSATTSLFLRRDVVIVASVSCIYGLGSPEDYLEYARNDFEPARVLDVDQLAQHLVAVDGVADAEQDHLLEVVLGRAEAVDAAHAGDDDDVAAQKERGGGGVAQPVDLVVDGRVFLDVQVLRRHVGLRLVVVVVTDEVLDGVARQELAELVAELRRQRLVVGDDQRGLLDLRDDVGHREGLARAGDAEQRLVTVAAQDAVAQRGDGLGLVAGEAVVGLDDEVVHRVDSTNTNTRSQETRSGSRGAAQPVAVGLPVDPARLEHAAHVGARLGIRDVGEAQGVALGARRGLPLPHRAGAGVVGGDGRDAVAAEHVEDGAQVVAAVADVDAGVVEVGGHEGHAARLPRDLRGRLGQKLHQPHGAVVRTGPGVEAALGVDDGRHQRGVEIVAASGSPDRALVRKRVHGARVPARSLHAAGARRHPENDAGEAGHDGQGEAKQQEAPHGLVSPAPPPAAGSMSARICATVCPTNSLSALRSPVLWNTKSLRAIFSSSGICWARRRSNSLSVSFAVRRRRRTSAGAVMSMTKSNTVSMPVSNSSGTSTAMTAGCGLTFCWAAAHSSTAACTCGCSSCSSHCSSS